MRTIHPTAVVDPAAEIGEGVSIGPFAVVGPNVRLGDGVVLHAHTVVDGRTTLGAGVTVFPHATVGMVPQDLKYHGEPSRLEVGEKTVIRECVTLHLGTEGGGMLTRVGSNCLLMANAHVAHDCVIGNEVVMSNNSTLAGHVTVDDCAILGGLSAVHQFSRIGRYAFVGGMTGIAQDLPPYMLAVGGRAGIHGPNIVGLRRLKVPASTVTAMRAAFRAIWLSGIPRQDALAQVEQEYAEIPQVLELVEFIRQSPRGVLFAAKQGQDDGN